MPSVCEIFLFFLDLSKREKHKTGFWNGGFSVHLQSGTYCSKFLHYDCGIFSCILLSFPPFIKPVFFGKHTERTSQTEFFFFLYQRKRTGHFKILFGEGSFILVLFFLFTESRTVLRWVRSLVPSGAGRRNRSRKKGFFRQRSCYKSMVSCKGKARLLLLSIFRGRKPFLENRFFSEKSSLEKGVFSRKTLFRKYGV